MNYSFKWLFVFSIPSILSSLLEPISSIVDSALVGNLNTIWLAAIAVAANIFNSLTWMFNFLVHASIQQISEVYQSESSDKVTGRIKISLFIGLVIGVISAVAMYLTRGFLYPLAGASESLLPSLDKYFVLRVFGHPFTILYTTMISILRGMSKVKLSFYIVLSTTILNIAVSSLLLFVFNFSIEGAAWGTISGNILGFVLCLIFILKDEKVNWSLFDFSLPKSDFFQFGKNSWFLFGRSAILTLAFFLSTRAAGAMGVATLAAHQIILQLWLIASFLTDGVAISGNILCARLLNEAPKEIKLLGKRLLILGLIIGLIFTAVYGLFGKSLWNLFSNDQELFWIIAAVWPLIFLSQGMNSVAFIYDGLMFGLSEFRFLRNMMLGIFLLIFLPMVLYAQAHNAFLVLWVAMVLINLLRLIFCHFKFNSIVRRLNNETV